MKQNKPKQPTLNEIFQTRSKAEQAERAMQLFNPVVSLIVTFDGRFGTTNVDVIGGNLTPNEARQVLTKGMEAISQKEAELLAQQAQQAQQPPSEITPPLEEDQLPLEA